MAIERSFEKRNLHKVCKLVPRAFCLHDRKVGKNRPDIELGFLHTNDWMYLYYHRQTISLYEITCPYRDWEIFANLRSWDRSGAPHCLIGTRQKTLMLDQAWWYHAWSWLSWPAKSMLAPCLIMVDSSSTLVHAWCIISDQGWHIKPDQALYINLD